MALLTKGATLKLDSTLVNGVKSMGEITEVTNKIEVTTLADEAQKFINGIKSYGDAISFTCVYDKAQYLKVRAMQNNAEHAVEIKYADGLTITFQAYVSTTLSGVEVDSAHEFTIELTPASAITIADGETLLSAKATK